MLRRDDITSLATRKEKKNLSPAGRKRIRQKFSRTSFVFFAYSPSDWSVEVGLWRFLATGREQKSAETFDSYTQP